MSYVAKDFSHLLGLPGFSDEALNIHFKLYQGYVTNTNTVAEKLKTLEAKSPEYNELKRRFGWEFNGMRLHEYHFGAMTGEPQPLDEGSALHQKIVQDFGSLTAWEADFKATAATRGIGWAILYYDDQEGRLFNTFINEHDLGHLAGAKLLLNLDVFEHAFMVDYKADRAAYIDAFMPVINWQEVSKRFGS